MGLRDAVRFIVSAEQTPATKPESGALPARRGRTAPPRARRRRRRPGGLGGRRRFGQGGGPALRGRDAFLHARRARAAGADAVVAESRRARPTRCSRATGARRRPPRAGRVAAQLALASPGADAWRRAELGGIRGITVGPIENGYHPGVGYGSPAYGRTLDEARAMGATWVAITPFGRVSDLSGTGVDLTFEAPFDRNRVAVARAIEMAHARGLRVMLVPHLWVESGGWRALIDPKTDDGWARWAESYQRFVLAWGRSPRRRTPRCSRSASSSGRG